MILGQPMCLSIAAGAPLPPFLLLKSAITGTSPRLDMHASLLQTVVDFPVYIYNLLF